MSEPERLFLTSAGQIPAFRTTLEAFRVAPVRTDCYCVVEDPEEATMILYLENYGEGEFQERIRYGAAFRADPSRVFTFCTVDQPVPLVPGLYASLFPGINRRGYTASGFYAADFMNPAVGLLPWEPGEMDLLFSFMGSAKTHLCRRGILALEDSEALLVDSSRQHRHDPGVEGNAASPFFQRYLDVLRRSRFVLCPRGVGANSIRLFETMKAGRVPVVISDDWIPMAGIDWESFIVRIPESDIASIPGRLRELEREAPERARRARAAWEAHFAPESALETVVKACQDLREQRGSGWRWRAIPAYRSLARPHHLKRYLRSRVPLRRELGYWAL